MTCRWGGAPIQWHVVTPPPPPPTARSTARPAARPTALGAALVAVALVATACGGAAAAARTNDAPVVTVAVGLWPLAQAAAAVGQGNVRVVDVVPAGQDPITYRLTAAQRQQVRHAGVVLEAAPSLQPSFTAAAAAAGAARVVDVAPAGPGYPWLSPYRMESVSRAIEAALVAADPQAKPTFANGNADEQALLASLDGDYQSTLATCPSQAMVTSDAAFTALDGRYPVHVVAIDGPALAPLRPDASTIAREVATVRSAGVHAVYRDRWQPIDGLLPMQAETDVALRTIDPLTGVPPGGWPHGLSSYFSLMESNLELIAGAMGCFAPGQG